jgi:hypothetical protein
MPHVISAKLRLHQRPGSQSESQTCHKNSNHKDDLISDAHRLNICPSWTRPLLASPALVPNWHPVRRTLSVALFASDLVVKAFAIESKVTIRCNNSSKPQSRGRTQRRPFKLIVERSPSFKNAFIQLMK